MHALMHCLLSQDSTKSLGSKKNLTKLIRNFEPAMAQARFTTRWAPYYCWWFRKILHQLIGWLSHYFQGFIHPMWCRSSSINSSSVVVNRVKTLLISGMGEGVDHLGHVDREQRMKIVRSCCHHSNKRGCQKAFKIFLNVKVVKISTNQI